MNRPMLTIVPSYDPHMAFARLTVDCYRAGWGDGLRYRVPVNAPNKSPFEQYFARSSDVEAVPCGAPFNATVAALLDGVDDREWVLWSISDRYPTALASRDTFEKVRAFLNAPSCDEFDALRLAPWRNEAPAADAAPIGVDGFQAVERARGDFNWGVWHHQFMRARYARDLFADPGAPKAGMDAINASIERRFKAGASYRVLLPLRPLARLGEPIFHGQFTINGLAALKEHHIEPPAAGEPVPATKIFTHPRSPAFNAFWSREASGEPIKDLSASDASHFIFSSGGVGSKYLLRSLGDIGVSRARHGHERIPPTRLPAGCSAIYVFGDPRDAVVSFFERRLKRHDRHHLGRASDRPAPGWVVDHLDNIESDMGPLNERWDLDTFLADGRDLFRLEEHFDSWLFAKRSFPTHFFRYEAFEPLAPRIALLLGVELSALEPVQERASNWTKTSQRDALDALYGPFARRLEMLPDFFAVDDGDVVVDATERAEAVAALAELLRPGARVRTSRDASMTTAS